MKKKVKMSTTSKTAEKEVNNIYLLKILSKILHNKHTLLLLSPAFTSHLTASQVLSLSLPSPCKSCLLLLVPSLAFYARCSCLLLDKS